MTNAASSPASLHCSPAPARLLNAGQRGAISLSLLPSQTLSAQSDVAEPLQTSITPRPIAPTRIRETSTPSEEQLGVTARPLSGDLLIRRAVLLEFCDSLPHVRERLEKLTLNQWLRLLRWLDYSGLALYFLDRLSELDREDLLPPSIHARLHQRLRDNTIRTQGMTAESIAIQLQFQESNVRYAILKGLSLWPGSVSKPELRSQFDLDFLVSEESAPAARAILESRGYRLYGISGNSWEFKRNERPGLSLKDMYKDLQSWRVELHIERVQSGRYSQLERLEYRDLCGIAMPVLSPIDLFVGHGLHTCKHICSEFMRTAQLLEFRRHVVYRRDDSKFWDQLCRSAGENRRIYLGLGIATLLITQVMGEFAPEALTSWTVRRLPTSVHLWCQLYGRRVALGSFPGSKLYLLLQKELEDEGFPAKRPARRALLPSRLPPAIIRAAPDESLHMRLRRYRMQFSFIVHRLVFHTVDGFRYLWELRQWNRQLNRFTR